MQLSTTLRRFVPARGRTAGFFGWLLAIDARARDRNRLAQLDAHALKDVGLSQSDVARELARPVWNAPMHWMR